MSSLSREDIQQLSRLARLELTDEEYDRYATQLSSVVSFVEQLQSVATDQVEDVNKGITGLQNALQEDEIRTQGDLATLDPMQAVAESPLHHGRFIEVRAVLGGEESA